ncbi:MAG: glycosyltransferase [Planctomycetota bacterium]
MSPRAAPAPRISFLAHEPAVARRGGDAARRSGGAGYAVAEQAAAVRRFLAAPARAGSAPLTILCPGTRGPARVAPAEGVVTFDAPAGSLDDLAERYVADPAWRRRFDALLGDAPVLAHHLPAARVTTSLGRPTLVALHSLWPSVQAEVAGGPPGPRAAACAALLEDAAAVLVATAAERDALLRTAPASARARDLAARVHVVPQAPSPFLVRLAARGGLARRRAAWRRRLVPRAAADDVVLYAVGRLVPYKRPLEVIEAFVRVASSVPRAHLLVVGPATDPGYAARCADAARAAPPDVAARIVLAGPQRLEAAPLAGDVLVHASRFESWGRAVDEALVLGRPAVLAPSPFVAERVEGRRPPGLAVPDAGPPSPEGPLWADPDAPAALDAALVRAATDAAWRRACGAAHRARAQALAGDRPVRALLTVWNDVEHAYRGTRPFVLDAPGTPPCAST